LLRDSAHSHQLCTAEIAIEVLKLAEDSEAAAALADYFSVFCRNYMAIKPHALEKIKLRSST
jgi:DTW domain-containing protein YfiP